jgi:hypothetical protein
LLSNTIGWSNAIVKTRKKELKFILDILKPFRNFSEANEIEFTGLDEQQLIQILIRNKVLSKFTKRLETHPNFAQRLFSVYPTLNALNEKCKKRQIDELKEFIRLSKRLATQGVNLLLIKSDGEFPHESSNFDCLIKTENLSLCDRIIRKEGYQELTLTREPHKYLYRKIASPRELPLHIHTRVEWEAAEFADSQKLIQRARPFLNEDTGALVPSIEDSILITIAHYFFEDHEIKLYDLLKVLTLSKESELDWDYMLNETAELGWSDAYSLNLRLLNWMCECWFSEKAFPELEKLKGSRQEQWVLKTTKFDSFGMVKIPYGVSALFFLRRVFRNSSVSFYQKSQHVEYVFSDMLRRRIIGYIEI